MVGLAARAKVRVLFAGMVCVVSMVGTGGCERSETRDALREPTSAEVEAEATPLLSPTSSPTGTPTSEPEPDELEVPYGDAPIIDGTFSDQEWDDALSLPMTNDGELMLKHNGGFLYMGIRSREMGFGSICTLDDDQISVLHSSAGLGTAKFVKEGEVWRRARQFSYCCWDGLERTMRSFLAREGWTASVGTKGAPDEMEYQISMEDESLTLAVVYVDDFTSWEAFYWPEDLVDDCLGLALIPEDPPEHLKFSPETWMTVIAGPPR